MTQAQTISAIRGIAPHMVARFIPETGEYRVTFSRQFMPDATKREDCAYYTNDAQDAIDTARVMADF